MNIYTNRNIAQSFCAKKVEIKKADDVQRAARLAFPFFSTTYQDEFCRRTAKKETFLQEKRQVLNEQRKYVNMLSSNGRNVKQKMFYTLNGLNHEKVGNCSEAATVTLSALFANGYFDSQKVSLEYRTTYIDKETNKTVHYIKNPLDHAIVVSSMGKNSDKEKDMVVIDSWIGFADSISQSKDKYNSLFAETIKKIQSNNDLEFINKLIKDGKITREEAQNQSEVLKKYKIHNNFIITESSYEKIDKDKAQEIGYFLGEIYPDLKIKK